MSKLVAPHGGGSLMPLLRPEAELADERQRAKTLTAVPMTSRETSDLLLLAMGAYTPLDGFMGHDDWRNVCVDMRLIDGLFWPIPITLSCGQDIADSVGIGQDVALIDQDSGEIMAILEIAEKYTIDKTLECSHVYRTTDPKHPGVAKIMAQGPVNLAGRVMALSEGDYPQRYKGLYFRPAETRAMFAQKGWSRVAAFQTRNPMHRSHEYLAKVAIEVKHEPRLALSGGADGLDIIRRIIFAAPALLKSGGYLLFEIGSGQGEAALKLLSHWDSKMCLRDYAGLDRLVIATSATSASGERT